MRGGKHKRIDDTRERAMDHRCAAWGNGARRHRRVARSVNRRRARRRYAGVQRLRLRLRRTDRYEDDPLCKSCSFRLPCDRSAYESTLTATVIDYQVLYRGTPIASGADAFLQCTQNRFFVGTPVRPLPGIPTSMRYVPAAGALAPASVIGRATIACWLAHGVAHSAPASVRRWASASGARASQALAACIYPLRKISAYALSAGTPPRCAYSTFEPGSNSPSRTLSIIACIDLPS